MSQSVTSRDIGRVCMSPILHLAPQVAVECLAPLAEVVAVHLAPLALAECLAPLVEMEGSLAALVDKGCEVGKDREM